MGKEELKGSIETSDFKKEIGVFGGINILGGIMIGSGIFYLGSYVMQRTHMSMGLSILCWVIGGMVSLLGGLCFAELGACDSRAGGMRVYLTRAYHPIVGYLSGIISCFLSGPGSIAGVAIALPTALNGYFHFDGLTIKIIAVVLIIGVTLINLYGVKQGAAVADISMIAKLVPIVLIMVCALLFGKIKPDMSLVPGDGTPVTLSGMLGMISFAVVATLWAYDGWVNLNSVAEEVKNPGKNLPLSIIGAIGGITILYAMFNYSIYRVLPYSEVVTMIEAGDLYLGTEVAKRILGNAGGIVVTAAMILAMFSSLNGMILTFSRVYYSMAEDNMFFKSFKQLHPQYKVPTASLWLQMVISILFVCLRSLNELTSLVVFAGQILTVMCISAVFAYRKKFPNMVRPYKAWGYPMTIVLAILANVGLMINSFIEDPMIAIISITILILGAMSYFYFLGRKKGTPNAG